MSSTLVSDLHTRGIRRGALRPPLLEDENIDDPKDQSETEHDGAWYETRDTGPVHQLCRADWWAARWLERL